MLDRVVLKNTLENIAKVPSKTNGMLKNFLTFPYNKQIEVQT